MRDPVLVDLDNYLDEEAKQEALQEAIDQKTDETHKYLIYLTFILPVVNLTNTK